MKSVCKCGVEWQTNSLMDADWIRRKAHCASVTEMGKVIVHLRELLERSAAELYDWADSFPESYGQEQTESILNDIEAALPPRTET